MRLDLLFTAGDATEVGWGMGVDARELQAALSRYASAGAGRTPAASDALFQFGRLRAPGRECVVAAMWP